MKKYKVHFAKGSDIVVVYVLAPQPFSAIAQAMKHLYEDQPGLVNLIDMMTWDVDIMEVTIPELIESWDFKGPGFIFWFIS